MLVKGSAVLPKQIAVLSDSTCGGVVWVPTSRIRENGRAGGYESIGADGMRAGGDDGAVKEREREGDGRSAWPALGSRDDDDDDDGHGGCKGGIRRSLRLYRPHLSTSSPPLPPLRLHLSTASTPSTPLPPLPPPATRTRRTSHPLNTPAFTAIASVPPRSAGSEHTSTSLNLNVLMRTRLRMDEESNLLLSVLVSVSLPIIDSPIAISGIDPHVSLLAEGSLDIAFPRRLPTNVLLTHPLNCAFGSLSCVFHVFHVLLRPPDRGPTFQLLELRASAVPHEWHDLDFLEISTDDEEARFEEQLQGGRAGALASSPSQPYSYTPRWGRGRGIVKRKGWRRVIRGSRNAEALPRLRRRKKTAAAAMMKELTQLPSRDPSPPGSIAEPSGTR
ncbi:hypothetical protein FA13DRAFT_1803264 [Coprinellus micaceus]|uniref:Uncharacterized protein n=1 Tax=Coprinellus micaceus TaxID=71717 RepID=A0A4Y7SAP5_COPMI|nr:hypothetical protein FA13DRAFT_1803264 [Coprinellus micaceus]